jgi:hypothetical protein
MFLSTFSKLMRADRLSIIAEEAFERTVPIENPEIEISFVISLMIMTHHVMLEIRHVISRFRDDDLPPTLMYRNPDLEFRRPFL